MSDISRYSPLLVALCSFLLPTDSDSSGFLSSDEDDDQQHDSSVCLLDSTPGRRQLVNDLCVGLLASLRA